ncbi:unnamed protein product, partial [Sphenostylis stenocarpa]
LGKKILAIRVEGDELRERLTCAEEENKAIMDKVADLSSLHELKVTTKVMTMKELTEIKDYVVQEHMEGFKKAIHQMHFFVGSGIS